MMSPSKVETYNQRKNKGQPRREWRGTAASRGYGHKWRKDRELFLAKHPYCAECEKMGRTAAATVVDHIIPHRGNQELFDDYDNLQGLCETCHNTKTGKGL